MNKEINTRYKSNFSSPSWTGRYIILLLTCLLLVACSGTKHLPKGEKLYTGAQIKLESNDKSGNGFIKATAEESVRPAPNKSYFGIRPKLWLYMAAGENPTNKFKKWLRKTGEAPVLLSSVKPRVTAAVIDAKLFNMGIFKSYTEFKIIEKKHTANIIYTSHIHKPYIIKDLVYAISDDSISRIIQSEKNKSLLKTGEDYSLELLMNERIRIDDLLKNRGYFYFDPNDLLFKADTSTVEKSITFRLTLKEDIPQNALTVYHINNVFINQNYSLREAQADSTKDTTMFQNTVFMGKEAEMSIHPRVISRSVYLRKHEVYSRENHTITLNRLMSMGNFKFVQVKFADSDTAATGFLDVTILMTPMPIHTFRAEMDLVSKSNNYTGPRMNLSLLNRNTFSGAELLNLNLAGSFEAQLTGASKNLYSYSWNPQVELTFPRFLVPFKIKQSNSIYVPKTRFTLSYNYLKRVDYFDMSTVQFTYGFKWKANFRTEHELNPINVSYTSIGNQSDKFTELLDSLPYLKKSYKEQFIAGGNYSFTYNEQALLSKKLQYFLHFTAETAGNVFSLAKTVFGEKIESDNPSKIVGSVYSQFAKLSVDGRAYYNFRDKNKIAFRVFAGVANAYGNSSILPYTKQFFSGGPNSVRAFQINSIGPGTFNQNDSTGFLQIGGDIKLEMNAEYRFNIYRFFKGALFVDAGNVWLQKSNLTNIGSPFQFSKFANELAVGAGIGLRMDVSFFILRFDLAMPLRKPWLPENERWVLNQIDFGSPAWRGKNLILNIAIGYPF